SIAATVSSIAANGLMPQVRLVRVRVEQRLLLAVVLELELDHPAVAVGRRVDECRFLVEAVIDRDDFARQRRIQLGDGLHRFDGAEHVVLVERRADLRQLDEHDVAELTLRVVGDADRHHAVAGGLHVFVVFCIEQILRDLGHDGLPGRLNRVDPRDAAGRRSLGAESTRGQNGCQEKSGGRARAPAGEGRYGAARVAGARAALTSATQTSCTRRSSCDSVPSFSTMKSARARLSSAGICAAIMSIASVSRRPRSATRRSSRTPRLASTRMMRSNRSVMCRSKRSGMSQTTIRSPRVRAWSTSRARRRSTSGWTIALSSSSWSWSPKTMRRRAARSRWPSGDCTAVPHRCTMRLYAAVPSSTARRASTSASMIVAPRSESSCATVDLPLPMLPVRPT